MLGVLGLNGVTVYVGLFEVANSIKEGDRVLVSGATDATDSTVDQIVKIKSAHVVGIAGSDEECDLLQGV